MYPCKALAATADADNGAGNLAANAAAAAAVGKAVRAARPRCIATPRKAAAAVQSAGPPAVGRLQRKAAVEGCASDQMPFMITITKSDHEHHRIHRSVSYEEE